MSLYEVEIKTKFNVIHLSTESLDDLTEILKQPYIINYKYCIVDNSQYPKLINTAKENNNQYGEKIITKSRTNSFNRYTK